MKRIDVALWELTKEEASQKTENDQILIYNPLTGRFRLEDGGKGSLARSKTAYGGLKYFSFKEQQNESSV